LGHVVENMSTVLRTAFIHIYLSGIATPLLLFICVRASTSMNGK